MADPASGRCWLFYYPSLTSLLVLLRPVDKPNFNILDPQGPVPRKWLAACKTLENLKAATELRQRKHKRDEEEELLSIPFFATQLKP